MSKFNASLLSGAYKVGSNLYIMSFQTSIICSPQYANNIIIKFNYILFTLRVSLVRKMYGALQATFVIRLICNENILISRS